MYNRWCLYIRHLSSTAYDVMRNSVIKLPSQRTLRDYTYYTEACVGFSSTVDRQLIELKLLVLQAAQNLRNM